MAKLNQVIAVEKGVKTRTYAEITALHKAVQKPELFNGLSKEDQPVNDADVPLPPEKKRVQFVVKDVLRSVERLNTELMNVTARKDWTNCHAKAPVVVDGKEIVPAAPVSYLLFLEKQLSDFHAIVVELPILDEADDWNLDSDSGLYKTAPTKTHRTKKVSKPVVLLQPTAEHPGQAQMVTEDIVAGYWNLTKMSGAIPKTKKQELLGRVELLQRAVKEAREAANMHEVEDVPDIGVAVYGFLLGE